MRIPFFAAAAAGLVASTLLAGQALAAPASETAFYQHVTGKWSGPGEIVAGKYRGTKFVCDFDGLKPESRKKGLKIDGSCRVGMFRQPMNALFERASTGYSGRFLDGEAGEGMDVVGGRYTRSKLVVDIKRKDLRGVMIAQLAEDDKLNVTISVRVGKRLIPVIGMSLVRRAAPDGIVTSSTDR